MTRGWAQKSEGPVHLKKVENLSQAVFLEKMRNDPGIRFEVKENHHQEPKGETALVLHMTINLPEEAKKRFGDFLSENQISSEGAAMVQADQFKKGELVIRDFDAIRKLALAGFEFEGAAVLREQEQRMQMQARGAGRG